MLARQTPAEERYELLKSTALTTNNDGAERIRIEEFDQDDTVLE